MEALKRIYLGLPPGLRARVPAGFEDWARARLLPLLDRTGGVRTYEEQSTALSGAASGVHDLYLVFRGGRHPCWIDWIRLDP